MSQTLTFTDSKCHRDQDRGLLPRPAPDACQSFVQSQNRVDGLYVDTTLKTPSRSFTSVKRTVSCRPRDITRADLSHIKVSRALDLPPKKGGRRPTPPRVRVVKRVGLLLPDASPGVLRTLPPGHSGPQFRRCRSSLGSVRDVFRPRRESTLRTLYEDVGCEGTGVRSGLRGVRPSRAEEFEGGSTSAVPGLREGPPTDQTS